MNSSVRSWWRNLIRRGRVEDELDAEVRGYLRLLIDEKVLRGMSLKEARRVALIELGGAEQVKQAVRDVRVGNWLESMVQDLRYGWRMLVRNPGFTVVAVLTLGLGIGTCTAIFSLVNAVLLRALPYRDVGRLVYLYTPNPNFKGIPVEAFGPAYADFFDIQRESHSYAAMTTFEQSAANLAAQESAQRVGIARVDGAFFSTLGVTPVLGRPIDATDNEPGHDGVAVISDSLWRTMFARKTDVLNKSLRLGGHSYRVVGVMGAEFGYPHSYDVVTGDNSIKTTEVWVPLALTGQKRTSRDDSTGYAVARLKPGVTVTQAQAELAAIMMRLDLLHEADMRGWSAFVKPFGQSAVGGMRPLMWSLLGAVTLVLLIACGNAANLLLARAASRTHELSVRATLGANRARVMRQMLTESLLIGLGGGVLGVVLAFGLMKGLVRLNPGNIPRLEDSSIDLRVLLFTMLVAVLTSVLFGILPALSVSRVNLVEFLKSGGNRGAVGARGRMQSALIVTEVALVVMLLAGAGLLLHSYVNVERVPTGFSPSTISMSVHLYAQYAQRDQRQTFCRRLLEKMAAVSGVESAGMISNLPLDKSQSGSMLWIEGNADRDQKLVGWRTVTEGYFPTMGIRLIEGRFFNDGDGDGRTPVVVVNEAFVKAYLAGHDPVGRRVRTSDTSTPWRTVVGVVGNVRDEKLETEAVPEVYLPLWQADGFGGSVVMRSRLPLVDIATAARTILRGIDPNLALTDVRSMGEIVSDATALRRFHTMLLTGFAVAALVLSLVGFYGLLSYGVKRRTAEIGLRIALGSPRAQVLGMVVRQGLSLVLMGLGIGLVGALLLTRVLAGSLYGVKPVDPVTFVGVPVLLLVVTVMASLIPGWRASGIEPVIALRSE